jgi:hypothetical protein
MSKESYSLPVNKLLEIGDTSDAESELDYVKEYGLEAKDVPELIRLATDQTVRFGESLEDEEDANPDDNSYWGPVHAWRALGQLKAVEAIEPLLTTLNWDEDDYPSSELPHVFANIGAPAIAPTVKFMEPVGGDTYPRVYAIDILQHIAEDVPELRDEIVGHLVKHFESYADEDPIFNGFLIGTLADLKVESALPTIQKAFEEGKADDSITDWNSIQYEFGLISEEEYQIQAEKNNAVRRESLRAEVATRTPSSQNTKKKANKPPKDAKAKAKSKRKMEKASRKKNRKK